MIIFFRKKNSLNSVNHFIDVSNNFFGWLIIILMKVGILGNCRLLCVLVLRVLYLPAYLFIKVATKYGLISLQVSVSGSNHIVCIFVYIFLDHEVSVETCIFVFVC